MALENQTPAAPSFSSSGIALSAIDRNYHNDSSVISAAVTSLKVTTHLRHKNIIKNSWKNHEFEIQAEELRAVQHRGGGRKEWRRKIGAKITVIVGLTNQNPRNSILLPRDAFILSVSFTFSDEGRLTPTTESILHDCPRFRILAMGKTGVGKSHLINKTFGVDDAVVAHNEVGYADINKEILSKANPHFILHDSKDFEFGDDFNVKIVHR